MDEIRWRTSTYSSSNGGACTEVAAVRDTVLVRDSTDPDGPRLPFGSKVWETFTAKVKGTPS